MMKKRITTVVLIAALAASQTVCPYEANSPDTGPVIGDNNGDSEYDIGERVDSVMGSGSTSGSSSVTGSGQGANAVEIGIRQTASETAVTTNSRDQAVVGDTAFEFVRGGDSVVAGPPEIAVNAISGINNSQPLNQVVPGVDLAGYNALVGTHAIVTKDAATNTGKIGLVEVPLCVPDLVGRLGEIQVLFYNNLTGTWALIQPNRIDTVSKVLWFNVPDSGTLSVIYKR